MRRPANLLIAMIIAIIAVWWIMHTPPQPSSMDVNDDSSIKPRPTPAPSTPLAAPLVPVANSPIPKLDDPDRSELLDDLNQPTGTIQSDLRLVQEVFAAWRTNFPREGNPVGENAEITRALTGDNALKLALVPKDHAAINRAGELTDRWGTPFRFHQLSGERMEIRSAGPDRRFGTADDAVLTP